MGERGYRSSVASANRKSLLGSISPIEVKAKKAIPQRLIVSTEKPRMKIGEYFFDKLLCV